MGCHLCHINWQYISQVNINFIQICFFIPLVEKVGESKHGHYHTFVYKLSHCNFMRAMRGRCQLIRQGWLWLHPSPYIFFHSETSPVGTFPSSVKPENISNCKDHQWVESWNEIFQATHWHELDLPEKVMRCCHGNREHHRYVKKVARRGVGGA